MGTGQKPPQASDSATERPLPGAAPPRRGLRRFIGPKRAAIAVLAVGALAIAWYLRNLGYFDPEFMRSLVRNHPVGAPIAFVLLYALAILTAAPTLPINLVAGLLWGPLLGGIYSTTGVTIGGLVAFLAARSVLGRPLAQRFDNRIIAEVQKEFAAHGWMFLAFVRVNPVFPTGPLNYIFGLTSIGAFTYTWVTFWFILPPSIAVAYIGESLGTFVVGGETAEFLSTILVISAAVTALVTFGYCARLWYRLKTSKAAQDLP